MKKTMLAAALAALAVGSASAETIYITGSTAFRGAANSQIDYTITNAGGTQNARDNATLASAGNVVWTTVGGDKVVACWNGSEAGIQSVAGPQSVTLKSPYIGSIITNAAVTNTFTGSTNPVDWTNGIITHTGTGANTLWKQVIASYKTTNMISDTVAATPNLISFWNPSQSFTLSNGVATGTISKTKAVGTIAFSDTYQASSAFGGGETVAYFATNNLDSSVTSPVTMAGIKVPTNRTVLVASNQYTTITNDIPVGIVGFGFVSSANAAIQNGTSFAGTNSAIANITKAQAAALFKLGKVNAAQFTGSLDDTNRFVYAVGRSIDSGTRLVTFSLLGLGSTVTNNSVASGVNSGINQYLILGTNGANKYSTYTESDGTLYASNSGSTLVITNWPAEVTVGKLCATGHNGYSSGGDLCNSVASVTSASSPGNAIVIGYAALADAAGKNANILSYEGVYPSTGAIKSGSYPFWSVEHILVNNAASATALAFASTVATSIQVKTTAQLQSLGKGTLLLSDVTNNVTRTVDGGTIVKLWTNSVTLTNLPSYSTTAKQANAGAGAGF
jgi:hypothetical protein